MDTQMIIDELQKCQNINELRKVNQYCYKKIGILVQMAALNFTVGDKVSWDSAGVGDRISGVIIKLLAKKARVKVGAVIWTVGITLLKKS